MDHFLDLIDYFYKREKEDRANKELEESTKVRAATPESEPEEDDAYYEDQAVLDVGMVGSDLIGSDAFTTIQVEKAAKPAT
ncbi:hypothetical protein L1987_48006 [Smallanthus sonchifolius]|uniref:Uncharacterized protein n=1 Tax=Smallanthus sonchifolius TaxID=185202 RepID=A0ACB9FRN3_9ASTR|nr:hypothetical protein L1987_48006 [Smallanthus sonchifolius]